MNYLVLVDLEKHSVQYEAWWLGHVQGLFGLGQPVDGVLQRSLEARCQGNGLIQLCLSGSKNMLSEALMAADNMARKGSKKPLTRLSSILELRLPHLFCSRLRFCWVWVAPSPASSPPRASSMDSP